MDSGNVINILHKKLSLSGACLAVAESLTGGEISSLITDKPGSSKYFLLGICAYANEAKERLLAVKKNTLKNFGAVSNECALEMHRGILEVSGADLAIATTGIAGPTGQTVKKPIGLVYIAYGSKKQVYCQEYQFSGDRLQIKRQTVFTALELLNSFLEEGKC